MARREVGEINAGSMADIAFLLLIFFLVTTTMEVDAGIGRTLPLKRDNVEQEPIDIRERDILEILANSNDQLMVEGKFIELDELEEIVVDFYTANSKGNETDPTMPTYELRTVSSCQVQIANLQTLLESDPDNADLNREKEKWETKLALCEEMPTKAYYEISKMSIIQLKNQANTSYGLYLEVQNILKKVVNDLRVKKCEELGWEDYYELDDKTIDGQEKIAMLRILVPERIVEARIDR
ncbi:MAG: biopolymer transporter ExbD [Flavobacteriales bacterium]|nr:biopolymer transporter ExbD [Flavobacteriales bacterium]